MRKRNILVLLLLALLVSALILPSSPVLAAGPVEDPDQELNYKGKVTQEEKEAAAERFKELYFQAKQHSVTTMALFDPATAPGHTTGDDGLPVAHYFGPYPNYALSPLPALDANGDPVEGTGIRKFVDSLPGLDSEGINNLGQYIPVAVADTETYPDSDYYEIAVIEYEEKMHSDLPPTKLRGYVQIATEKVPGGQIPLKYLDGDDDPNNNPPILKGNGEPAIAVDYPHYLGPVIVAQKDKPVRVKFYNLLPTGAGGDLFIPVDTTVMGAGMGPVMDMDTNEPVNYTQNRATLHLHGGRTPWISDGTPHQWITPAGEDTPYPEGVSVYDVPDMEDPGDGAMTFFYSNQQSARFMFYHDHSYGITRLNVYAGEAAGYMIQDETELDLIDRDILPADQIPLIIQDKTFVPDPDVPFSNIFGEWESQMAFYDPTWDTDKWGDFGDLWYPHVYMPVQNPDDLSGVNAFGRWHYGPWFWPPTSNIEFPPVENPYYDPVNAPWEPRFIPGTPNNSTGMESFFDTPVVNGTAYPYLEVDPKSYRFRILNAANDRFWNLQLHEADPNVTTFDGRTNTEVKMVPAEVTSNLPEGWPTDGREGGVPDPLLKGPPMVQIGTEGGFLPEPVVLENQPIVWNLDPTTFNVGNVESGNLIIAPAERADVIVDFSAYAGKTLILYNDAPAPFPALAKQYDYYTGAPDMTDTGSSPGTQPGFGPNTRTIMQIRVKAADVVTPAEPFNLEALNNEFVPGDGNGVFVRGQDEIIVGQSAYDAVYNKTFPATAPYWGVSNIQDNYLNFETVSGDQVTNFYMEPKAIQDEMGEAFDEYGRMSGFLGLELPFTAAGIQNFVLFGYASPPVEIIPLGLQTDGTQIWKITHNGVDTHPIHFHMFEVQVINRVGWDGAVRMPDANELGWKETVRVSPLEDTIVALRPVVPTLPFDLPNSIRLLDVTQPEGTMLVNSTQAELDGFGKIAFDPYGEVIDIVNHYVNFGWEYVWHCHILSHEEMDMMHALVVGTSPVTPSDLTVDSIAGSTVNLSWLDNSENETHWTVQRSAGLAWETVEVVPSTTGPGTGDTVTYADNTINASGSYSYRVIANNIIGDTNDYTDPNLNLGASFPWESVDSAVSNEAYAGEITPSSITVTLSGVTADVPLVLDMAGTVQSDVVLTGDGFTLDINTGDILLGVNGYPLTNITVTPGNNAPIPPVENALVKAWNFAPDGATFNPGMTMTVNYNPAQLPAGVQEQGLMLAFWDPASMAWIPVTNQTQDTGTNTITATVEHFTFYAVLGIHASVNLVEGWNLFSVPFKMHTSYDTWGEIVTANALDIQAAYRWNGTSFGWVDGTQVMSPLDAIYVKMNAPGTVSLVPFSGISMPPNRSLNAGWNLVGSAFIDATKPVNEALTSAYYSTGSEWGYSQVISPSGVNQSNWVYVRDVGVPPEMQMGKGYWVYMTNPASVAGFTSTP